MSDYTPTTEQVRDLWVDGLFEGIAGDEAVTDADWDKDRRAAQFDRWLAAHDAEVRAEAAEAHERTKRGVKTLGEIVVRQVEDTLRWAGMEDQIGTDDPDQQLAWERCAEMPGRIAELEAELAEVRAGVVAEEPEWAVSVARATGYGDPVIYDFRDRLAAERFIKNPPLWFSREDNQTKMLVSRRKAGPWVPVEQEGDEP